MKFFDFSNIKNLESRACLGQNIIQLLEKQLNLLNGQYLWEAFLYLNEICQEKFTFKFTFELNDSVAPNIRLNKCANDPDNPEKKIFFFSIRCNKRFSERIFAREEILEENMLYRPCLIKLNGKYHLREQKFPLFIVLAHEFLHALNQLECIEKISLENVKLDILVTESSIELYEKLDLKKSIQTFLREKLGIEGNSIILKKEYTKLWQNDDIDDSLDEMTVILKGSRQTEHGPVVIGETTFLREFYEDNTIISWSHDNARRYLFYKESMNTLLEPVYVDSVLAKFGFPTTDVQAITLEKSCCPVLLHECGRSDIIKKNEDVKKAIEEISFDNRIIRLKRRGSSIFQFISCPPLDGVKLLPIVSNWKTALTINGYNIIDVPADGNCAFTSVKVAMNDEEFKDKLEGKLTPNQLDAIMALREATADKIKKVVTDQDDFVENLRQLGYWNSGIDEREIGIEVLSFVAEVINRPVLVIKQEPNDKYHYWISGTTENPRDGNLIFHDVEEKDLEMFLNSHPDTIKLFHNGVYFQALRKTTIGLDGIVPPPPPISALSGRPNRAIDPFTVSPGIGTPPSGTDTAETAIMKREEEESQRSEKNLEEIIGPQITEANYHIQDVRGDGNCGFYAILKCLHPDENYEHVIQRDKNWENAEKLRSEIFPTGSNLSQMVTNWPDPLQNNRFLPLDFEVLSTIARAQERPIIVINSTYVANPAFEDPTAENVNYMFITVRPEGSIETSSSIKFKDFLKSADENPIVLLYTPNHWKAVISNPSTKSSNKTSD